MSGLSMIYLARHGETEWSLSGQHTWLTDLPLTARGERNARRLGERLDRDLVEWDYGEYDGLRTGDIRATRPDWQAFRDGLPGGETFDQIGARADRVLNLVRSRGGPILLFSSADFLRILAARWLGLEPQVARYFPLDTASLGALTRDREDSASAIGLWNDTSHVSANCREEYN